MTSKSLKQRLRKHIDNALYTKHNPHLCNWILKLIKNNKLPIIELIEECGKENWQEREIYWISNFNNLLNYTKGGEGSFGYKHSKETLSLLRIQKLGHLQSTETKLKRSKSLLGRIITEEHRSKIGFSNKGKIYTKYKIKIIDTINKLEYIFNTAKECGEFLKCGSKTTVYRNLDTNRLFRNKYLIVKI